MSCCVAFYVVLLMTGLNAMGGIHCKEAEKQRGAKDNNKYK